MDLSTTTGETQSFCGMATYTKHIEKNGMIWWRCACRASKHCPASAYTDLLPANPVLKTDDNHCPEPVKLEVDRCQTDMSTGIRATASNDPPARIYILPKCPVTKMSVTKTSITKVSFTEMSGYPIPDPFGEYKTRL